MKLFKHQKQALEELKDLNRVALYWDMGLGKTFGGSEKMRQLGARVNLVICQKSKINDWCEHFNTYYSDWLVYDLAEKSHLEIFLSMQIYPTNKCVVGIINYELAFRRPELLKFKDFTLMLDESSLIQNEEAKRSKFILKLQPKNVILLSGTPTGGKYEKLWSQMSLLGWNINKNLFYRQYVDYHWDDDEGFPIMIVDGYKNEERLKRKMREYGCHFLKTDEVFDLPEQVHQTIEVATTKEYRKFRKNRIILLNSLSMEEIVLPEAQKGYHNDLEKLKTPWVELVGDTTLTKMLYERQLCGLYNKDKLGAFRNLVESTDDRLIVFYNFNYEFFAMSEIANELGRKQSIVSGKTKDLFNYENEDDSITFIQYQAGSMGLNLQKANKIIYFTPPLSSESFEQSKKRIHRIGQQNTCFYYYLTCKGSIEEKIYRTLEMRRDFTEALFEEGLDE